MQILTATIPGEPVGKARPRFDGRTRRTYTPEQTSTWEERAALILRSQWQGAPALDEPCVLVVEAVLPRLKGSRQVGRVPAAAKPDWDNVAKAVADAVEKAGVVVNDSRIFRAVVTKWRAAQGEEPHVRVVLRTAIPEDLEG